MACVEVTKLAPAELQLPRLTIAWLHCESTVLYKYTLAAAHGSPADRMKATRGQECTQESAQHADVDERLYEKEITPDNEQESQQTTDRCSPFLWNTQSPSTITLSPLYHVQPQIQCRDPRSKAHWYMHWIIIIKDYHTLEYWIDGFVWRRREWKMAWL